jgi:hypothetical protein
VFSNIYQHLVALLVQPPLQSELAGVDLSSGGRLPDLDAAISILEQVMRHVFVENFVASKSDSGFCP